MATKDKMVLLEELAGKINPPGKGDEPLTGAFHYGSFNIGYKSIHVGDPCYNYVSHSVRNVENGVWNTWGFEAAVEGWGNRIAFLVCLHQSVGKPVAALSWRHDGVVGVDSGQMGVYAHFPTSEEHDSFYDRYCEASNNRETQGGQVGRSVVCSSGVGDGSYRVLTAKGGGRKVVGVIVDFGLSKLPKLTMREDLKALADERLAKEMEKFVDGIPAEEV